MYDILIIGGGPGGYVAAIRAAQLGFKVGLVEREHLGGICLNWGCIPTKSLLRSAEILTYARHSQNYGVSISGDIGFDLPAMIQRSRHVSERLNGGVSFLLKKNKVDVIWGEATLEGLGKVRVAPSKKPPHQPQHAIPQHILPEGLYEARHIILATGARPRILPGIEPDGERIWTYFEALKTREVPRSLVIMGSGAIGVEFASFYRALGCEVTIVEILPHILPTEDAEVAAHARKVFEAQGIHICTQTKMTHIDKTNDHLLCTLEDASGKTRTLTATHLLSAIGIVGNVEGLGLEALGVKMERGCLVTDGQGRTNIKGIYAIGDVAGPPMLAHKAEHEGVICVEAIKGLPTHPLEKTRIPGCVYCHPQIASVGYTEIKAKEAGFAVKVGRFSFAGNGKAIALGEPDGFIKTIFDSKTGRLLGAHMIGAEVTELIQGFVIAMGLETTEEELLHTIFPHPTLSEIMHESVLNAYGRTLHG